MARAAWNATELREDLLTHAHIIVSREGVSGLTMRALATEAGTAVGLSYKAFDSREDLLWELAWRSLRELVDQIDEWSARLGGVLGERIMEFADLHFDSIAPELVDAVTRGPRGKEFLRAAVQGGVTRSWPAVMTDFLRSRQESGDIRGDIEVADFGYVLTAAIHDALATAPPLTAPDRPTLARHIAGVAALLTQQM